MEIYGNFKNRKMKLKSLIAITAALLICVGPIQAQGIFSNKKEEKKGVTTANDNNKLLRAPTDPPSGGGEGPGTGTNETPVGEGIIILSLLAGGYTVLKKTGKKRLNTHED
jgi:hypothetical protein